MAWLDTLLAFAIAMMVLSTIVSAIVEAAHSLMNQRVKGLERLMEQMFNKVISPQLAGQLPADLTGSRFVNQMTDMRWVPIGRDASKFKRAWISLLNKLRRTDKIQSLTTLEFFERLADSEVGEALLKRSKKIDDKDEALSLVLEHMANKFEAFGGEASRYFARRARIFSVLIGFVLVFSINFSSVDVVKFLMQSEESRTALIEQGNQIAEKLNEQIASTERTIQAAREEGAEVPEFDAGELEQNISGSLRTLQQANLPIGWEYAPWRTSDTALTPWQYVTWFLSVFGAGLLVGLGGPFWFDLFRKLSALSSVARVFKSEVMQDVDSAKKDTPTKHKHRFVGVFKTARKASEFARAAGRQPLTQDGSAIPIGHLR